MQWTYTRNEDGTEDFTPEPHGIDWDKHRDVDFIRVEGGTGAIHTVVKDGDPASPIPPVVDEINVLVDWFLPPFNLVRQLQAEGNTEPTFTVTIDP